MIRIRTCASLAAYLNIISILLPITVAMSSGGYAQTASINTLTDMKESIALISQGIAQFPKAIEIMAKNDSLKETLINQKCEYYHRYMGLSFSFSHSVAHISYGHHVTVIDGKEEGGNIKLLMGLYLLNPSEILWNTIRKELALDISEIIPVYNVEGESPLLFRQMYRLMHELQPPKYDEIYKLVDVLEPATPPELAKFKAAESNAEDLITRAKPMVDQLRRNGVKFRDEVRGVDCHPKP